MPLLHREELDLDQVVAEFVEFDKSFVEYFEFMISSIVPSEYVEYNKFDIGTYIIYSSSLYIINSFFILYIIFYSYKY